MVTVTFFPIFFENGEKHNCHHFAEVSAVPCRSVSQLDSYPYRTILPGLRRWAKRHEPKGA
jgi:hypothetical protein